MNYLTSIKTCSAILLAGALVACAPAPTKIQVEGTELCQYFDFRPPQRLTNDELIEISRTNREAGKMLVLYRRDYICHCIEGFDLNEADACVESLRRSQ